MATARSRSYHTDGQIIHLTQPDADAPDRLEPFSIKLRSRVLDHIKREAEQKKTSQSDIARALIEKALSSEDAAVEINNLRRQILAQTKTIEDLTAITTAGFGALLRTLAEDGESFSLDYANEFVRALSGKE